MIKIANVASKGRELDNKLLISKKIFSEAKKFFLNNPNGDMLPVVDESDNLLFYLYYEVNLIRASFFGNAHSYDQLDYYDFTDGYVNETLIAKAQAYVFWELNEFTHAIAIYVAEHFPEKRIYFLDKLATNDVWGEYRRSVHILASVAELPEPCRYMFIDAKNKYEYPCTPSFLTLSYNSLNVMRSMLWGGHSVHLGKRLSGQKVALLDFSCPYEGLENIIIGICNWARAAEKQGYIPVTALTDTQYAETGTQDVWGELFEPLSGITPQEALECEHLITASREDWRLVNDWCDPYCREAEYYAQHEGDYVSRTKLNIVTAEFVRSHLPIQILHKESEEHILGVIARGSDRRNEAVKAIGITGDYNASLEEILNESRMMMERGNYKWLFLATEEQAYLEAFQQEFGKRLLFVDQPRVSHDYEHDGYVPVSKLLHGKVPNITMARLYITVLKGLSACDSLLASTPSGVYRQAKRWNAGNYDLCKVLNGHNSLAQIEQPLPDWVGEKIILYGLGNSARLIQPWLRLQPERFLLCDRRARAGLKSFEGIPVVTPEEMLHRSRDSYIIITAFKYENEIFDWLLSQGVDSRRILYGFLKWWQEHEPSQRSLKPNSGTFSR